MLKGWQLMDIAELLACGHSIRKIAVITGYSKNTVKKYLRSREVPKYKPRAKRPSKLDPFKPLIRHWLDKGITNGEVLLRKIREQGYAGGKSILKDYVKAFRPPRQPPAVMRYETAPGEQAQVDYGEVKYLGTDGVTYRLYCFVMVLGYSRDLYVEFSRSANIAAFLQAHVRALEYFGGVPRRILYDNAKVVRIGTDQQGKPVWHTRLFDLARVFGFTPSVHFPYRPCTKGKVEASVKYVKHNFWPGREFVDELDLNRQALAWCEEVSRRKHGTTGRRPADLKQNEPLQSLPDMALRRPFITVRHKVQRDGLVAFDGALYGVPWSLTGREVEIWPIGENLEFFYQGEIVARHRVARPGQRVVAMDNQWLGLEPAARPQRPQDQLAYQLDGSVVSVRPLAEYEVFAGGELS